MKLEIIESTGYLQIDEARIVYRNFEGRPGLYNDEGDRSFSLVIKGETNAETEEMATLLMDRGWNVRIKAARPEVQDDTPFYHLPVKVKFNSRGPACYLVNTNGNQIRLDEDSVGMLDKIDIADVSLDIRPYDWEHGRQKGRSAYLHAIKVKQAITDRFTEEYNAMDIAPAF